MVLATRPRGLGPPSGASPAAKRATPSTQLSSARRLARASTSPGPRGPGHRQGAGGDSRAPGPRRRPRNAGLPQGPPSQRAQRTTSTPRYQGRRPGWAFRVPREGWPIAAPGAGRAGPGPEGRGGPRQEGHHGRMIDLRDHQDPLGPLPVGVGPGPGQEDPAPDAAVVPGGLAKAVRRARPRARRQRPAQVVRSRPRAQGRRPLWASASNSAMPKAACSGLRRRSARGVASFPPSGPTGRTGGAAAFRRSGAPARRRLTIRSPARPSP